MPPTNSSTDIFADIADALKGVTENINTQAQKVFTQTTVSTGQTLDWIAANPVLQAAEKIPGFDWLMTFLGKTDTAKIQANVAKMRSQYPQETANQIAERLIVQKSWQAARIGLITNIVPPIAALFLGIELVATTKLQTEMVYEIAAAHNLNLADPARRGEVMAIFALSLGADVLKTGLTVVEILPGIGAVVGASTNAALLYVLGKTASGFYQNQTSQTDNSAIVQVNQDWLIALEQTKIMDLIVAHMVTVSYPEPDWKTILPIIQQLFPESADYIAVNLGKPQDLTILLERLRPEFAPLTLTRCYEIAKSTDVITSNEQAILREITSKFNLDIANLEL